jgi:hypothetical protein
LIQVTVVPLAILSTDGAYLNSLIPIVGGVTAATGGPVSRSNMVSASTARAAAARRGLVLFMDDVVPSSAVQTFDDPRRSKHLSACRSERIAWSSVSFVRGFP